jgi:hypothetical protein
LGCIHLTIHQRELDAINMVVWQIGASRYMTIAAALIQIDKFLNHRY